MVIGIGIDIQEISRIERAIERGEDAFLKKTFTENEIDYCIKQKRSGQHFAGRFCAKEALFKALGTGWSQGVKWTDADVTKQSSGCPEIILSGKAAELAEQAGVEKIWLSLSHSDGYAAATVVLEGRS